MKTRLSLIILSAVLVCACSPDSAMEYDFSNYRIDKVVCGAGSNYLIADNISELDLNVKIYTKIGTYTDIYGEQRDMYTEIPKERWRNHDVKFYVNGSQATPPIKTSSASPTTLQCYAEVDGIRSSQSPAKLLALYPPYHDKTKSDDTAPEYSPDPDPLYFEVKVRAAYTPPARRIPVVFHIVELRENAKRGQELESSAVYAMIDLLNKVYGRKNSTASCGANPNLEFVPVVRNASGTKLAEPGINRIYVEDTEVSNFTGNYTTWIWNLNKTDEGLDMNDARYTALLASGKLPARTPRAFWNPDRYLNVWVLYNYAQVSELSFTNLLSAYIPRVYSEGTYNNSDFPLPAMWQNVLRIMTPDQLAMWKKNPYDLRLPPEKFSEKIKDLGQAGIYMPKQAVANYEVSITQYVGAFLGLIPNAPASKSIDYQATPNSTIAKVWLDDYCDDTPAYNRWFDDTQYGGIVPSGTTRTKYTVTAPYFVYDSFNIMECNSATSYISQDQVKRMQWVLENAPGRQMWKDTWAID